MKNISKISPKNVLNFALGFFILSLPLAAQAATSQVNASDMATVVSLAPDSQKASADEKSKSDKAAKVVADQKDKPKPKPKPGPREDGEGDN